MEATLAPFDTWLSEVKAALDSINMPSETWQAATPFDFSREFKSGSAANAAAAKANKFWWRKQNQVIHEDCRLTIGCWLPRRHQGECEPA
jgi:hypothetical protein